MSLIPFFLEECRPARRSENPYWGSVSVNPTEDILRPVLGLLSQMTDLNELRSQLSTVDPNTTIQTDKDKFQASIDVQQFKPEEISVKVTGDNTVTIEGKHEEKADEHGLISRHFVRRYVLPDNVDMQGLQSKLSSDGVLTVQAPKKPEGKQVEYREIPVIRTGQAVQSVEQKKETEAVKEKSKM